MIISRPEQVCRPKKINRATKKIEFDGTNSYAFVAEIFDREKTNATQIITIDWALHTCHTIISHQRLGRWWSPWWLRFRAKCCWLTAASKSGRVNGDWHRKMTLFGQFLLAHRHTQWAMSCHLFECVLHFAQHEEKNVFDSVAADPPPHWIELFSISTFHV